MTELTEVTRLFKECRSMTQSLLNDLKAMKEEQDREWAEIAAMIADCQARVQTIKSISFN